MKNKVEFYKSEIETLKLDKFRLETYIERNP